MMDADHNRNSYFIQIKKLDGSINRLNVNKEMTVRTLKEKIQDYSNIPVHEQRLLFKKRILQDDKNIEEYNITDNDIIFLTFNNPQIPSTPIVPNPPPIATNSTVNIPSPFGGGNLNIPEEFLNSMLQQLMENPDIIRSFIENNPYLSQVRERNPELSHILDDPQLLRQSMELIRNPSLMREMTRTADRAMSNIEAVPGGFNALRRMYQNFQEPIWHAALQRRTGPGETGTPNETPYNLRTELPPNSETLPNPWDTAPDISQNFSNMRNRINPRLASNLSSNFDNSQFTPPQRNPEPNTNPLQQYPTAQSSTSNNSMNANIPSPENRSQNFPESRYTTQLTALRNMGFTDTQRCIQALEQSGGNLNRAIDRLLNE